MISPRLHDNVPALFLSTFSWIHACQLWISYFALSRCRISGNPTLESHTAGAVFIVNRSKSRPQRTWYLTSIARFQRTREFLTKNTKKRKQRESLPRADKKERMIISRPLPPPELPGHVTYDPSPETKIVRLMWVTYGWTSKNK